MVDVNYAIRNMTEKDVPQVLDIRRETGMQQGTHCIYTWLKVHPEAIYIAVTDEGDVLGVCSGCIQHDDLAHVGLYTVRKKYQGLGIGIEVWNAVMDHIGDRNACLNAVPSRVEMYRDTTGFPIVEEDWVCVVNETHDPVHPENLLDTPPSGVDIQPFEDSHLPLMHKLDRKITGYNREQIIELNCKEVNSKTYVALKDGACVGFGTIKISCQETRQVGPLYAEDEDIAEVLLKKLILSLPKVKGFVMMTLSMNGPAEEFMKKIGCPTTVECTRLYRKKKVDADKEKNFALLDISFSPY